MSHHHDGCNHDHGFLSSIRGHSHEYDIETKEDRKRLIYCMLANGTYGVLQLSVGFVLLGSLILVTDALHNLSDMISLSIPLLVIMLQGRRRTVSSGLVLLNYLLLLLFLAWAIWESALRVFHPESATGALVATIRIPLVGPVNSGIVMACLAGVGIGVNAYSVFALQKGKERDLNMRSAFQHQLVDLIASVTAVIGSAMIAITGQRLIDPGLTIAVSLALIWMVTPNLKQAYRDLSEATIGGGNKEHAH